MIIAIDSTSTWLSALTEWVAQVHSSILAECQERIAPLALVIRSSSVSVGIVDVDSFVYAVVAANSTGHGKSHIFGTYQDIYLFIVF